MSVLPAAAPPSAWCRAPGLCVGVLPWRRFSVADEDGEGGRPAVRAVEGGVRVAGARQPRRALLPRRRGRRVASRRRRHREEPAPHALRGLGGLQRRVGVRRRR